MGWLSILLGLADPIEKITEAIIKARADALNATTEQEKIASAERIATLQARRDVLVAEAGISRANIWVRTVFAILVLPIVPKLITWDKVVGSFAGCSQAPRGTCGIFTTDPLDANEWHIIMIVIGFYFLYEGAGAVARIIKH